MDESWLLEASATKIAEAIRLGHASSRQAVEAHIDEAQRRNPAINAIVVERFEAARQEADLADAEVAAARGDAAGLPPLWGVPCTIKESFAFAGLPNTSGLVARRGIVAQDDATTVERLKAAGAICLGLTNISELCMWMESNNRVYGRCNNPYDPRRIVGGSSGGEGAIVGSGASPIGLGADIGGSIRMPAFFCGAFGHKPTGGTVPATGQWPMAENEALRMLATGPITRRAEDLMPLTELLAGPDGRDPSCRARGLGDPSQVRIDKTRVVVIRGNRRHPASTDMLDAQERAAQALGRRGAKVSEVEVPELDRVFELWAARMDKAADTKFRALLTDCGPDLRRRDVGIELVKWATGRSAHTLPALGLAVIESLPIAGRNSEDRLAEARELTRILIDEMEGGVLLYPSYSRTAPRHNMPLALAFHFAYTAAFNVTEFPVTQVPLGLDRRGLPLGVQVAGGHGADHQTIAVALALEDAFGGWVRPPRFVS